uniref:Serine-threonine protein kinase plant-type n=1 Tax=Rhizophora mucronata TaxID=61149 RepID=A0A2P2KXQ0_RHIMU
MLELAKLWSQSPRNIRISQIQTNHMIVDITGDMEPGAGIDKGWVPALQHICWIREPASQSMQSISCNTKWKREAKETTKAQNNKEIKKRSELENQTICLLAKKSNSKFETQIPKQIILILFYKY